MAYESFGTAMSSLAAAVRAKFGVSGQLTVADMTTAVSGVTHASHGATLAGFNADMTALADAIRAKSGTVGAMSITEMASAVAGITLGYTTFADENECETFDVEGCNRIAVNLTAGAYGGFEIHGLSSRPTEIRYGSNTTGLGGTVAQFTYSGGTASLGNITGGKLVIYTDADEIMLSPESNFASGFDYPLAVYKASVSQTAINSVLAVGYCLMLSFTSYGGVI